MRTSIAWLTGPSSRSSARAPGGQPNVARFAVLRIAAMEVPPVRCCRIRIRAYGRRDLETLCMKTKGQAAATSKQVQYTETATRRDPADILTNAVAKVLHQASS